jgi:hypothetical protein
MAGSHGPLAGHILGWARPGLGTAWAGHCRTSPGDGAAQVAAPPKGRRLAKGQRLKSGPHGSGHAEPGHRRVRPTKVPPAQVEARTIRDVQASHEPQVPGRLRLRTAEIGRRSARTGPPHPAPSQEPARGSKRMPPPGRSELLRVASHPMGHHRRQPGRGARPRNAIACRRPCPARPTTRLRGAPAAGCRGTQRWTHGISKACLHPVIGSWRRGASARGRADRREGRASPPSGAAPGASGSGRTRAPTGGMRTGLSCARPGAPRRRAPSDAARCSRVTWTVMPIGAGTAGRIGAEPAAGGALRPRPGA